MDDRVTKIAEIVAKIAPHLAGQPDEIQGAILGHLTAIWVAGHRLEGQDTSSEETKEMRKWLLSSHTKLVTRLIPDMDRLLEADHGSVQ